MTRTARLIGPVAAVPVLAGCGIFGDPGPETSQDRPVSEVTAVELATGGTLTVTEGTSPRLTISAGENVIDRLTSDVSDGALVLDAEGSGNLGTVRYDLVLPRLERLGVSGSGDTTVDGVPADSLEIGVEGSGGVTATGLDTQDLVVRLSGSGNVEVAGTTDAQDVDVEGSGSYLAAELESRTARVDVEGSGDADVQVSGQLDAVVSGSGSITYSGNPSVQSRVGGSGDISAR